jgi:hypothetical protein
MRDLHHPKVVRTEVEIFHVFFINLIKNWMIWYMGRNINESYDIPFALLYCLKTAYRKTHWKLSLWSYRNYARLWRDSAISVALGYYI